ncbi:tryptophan synthase subunit alpha [Chloroflexota bacterium]
MSRIGSVLVSAAHKALMPYVTIGYPSVEATLELVPDLASWGCDIIELGIPFSDPLADGATIQRSSYQALQNGVTPRSCLEIAGKIRARIDTPLIFMTYYNLIFHFGLESFCRASAEAGVDGLIIPDLPPEEGAELEACCQNNGLDLIYLLAPTSNEARIEMVAQRSSGFIYIVSLAGVTGARDCLPVDLEELVSKVRSKTSLPLCVGFGVSTPEIAQRVAKIADGVIVGSRLIQLMDNYPSEELRGFVAGLRNSIDSVKK